MKAIQSNAHKIFMGIAFLITLNGLGQINLVPNPSFEQYTICPYNINDAAIRNGKPDFWYKPDKRAGGYINACSNDSSWGGVPMHNIVGGVGYQFARTGNAYIGMAYLNNNSNNYFQVKLLDSLLSNKYYYAECYVNLFNVSNWASNNQGMLFTKKAVYVDTANYTFMLANAQVENKYIIQDTLNWVKISGVFKAQGGEQYLTLGNFKLANATQKITIQTTGNYAAAYYVDDVAVYALDSFCLKADAGKDTTIQQGDSVFIGSYTNGIDTIRWLNGSTVIDSVRPGFWVKPTVTTSYTLCQVVNGCYSCDTVTVNVNPLPLKFISFTISQSISSPVGGVRGGWATANEVNVSHYNVQRSTNGKDFITVGKVKANNKVLNEYRYTDDRLPLTIDGQLYYRIVGVDFDGKMTYSEVKTLNIKHSSLNITIFPNPAKDVVNIVGKNIKEVKVFDIMGKQIATGTNLRNDGDNYRISLNIEQYQSGIYLLTIKTNNNYVTQKFIKY